MSINLHDDDEFFFSFFFLFVWRYNRPKNEKRRKTIQNVFLQKTVFFFFLSSFNSRDDDPITSFVNSFIDELKLPPFITQLINKFFMPLIHKFIKNITNSFMQKISILS